MKFKHIMVSSVAAAILTTVAAHHAEAQANESNISTKTQHHVLQEEYNTLQKLFEVVKRNTTLSTPSATVTFTDGTTKTVDLTRLPNDSEKDQKITGTIQTVTYKLKDGSEKRVDVKDLDDYLPKTLGDYFELTEELYKPGDRVTIKLSDGTQVKYEVGKSLEEQKLDPNKRIVVVGEEIEEI